MKVIGIDAENDHEANDMLLFIPKMITIMLDSIVQLTPHTCDESGGMPHTTMSHGPTLILLCFSVSIVEKHADYTVDMLRII